MPMLDHTLPKGALSRHDDPEGGHGFAEERPAALQQVGR